ncbi:MAG: dTDP-4-amino-4,6-dideoxygalactose transaminase [Kiritimatiellae bacterium]|nr:dTDP-4-amino-4,6-dideoxygalactose transaminase [Kiritimatiellia bacterium]
MNIPFNRPSYDETEAMAVADVVRSGAIVGDGAWTQRATEELKRQLGAEHVLLTPSCTHALELAIMTLNLRGADEVIVPSFAYPSSAACVLRGGGRLVFADIRADTLSLDPGDFRRRITPKTKVVIPLNYAGITADMNELCAVAHEHAITVIEDAAQGMASFYHGRPAGTIGDIGNLSFHETKNYSTGEGGAFITNDPDIAARAEIIREKGTNRGDFVRGLTDKYVWITPGSSLLPPDTMGALLLSQLAKRKWIQATRKRIYEDYVHTLTPLAERGELTLPTIPPGSESNHHIFHVLMRDAEACDRAIVFFQERGISVTRHYQPLHLSPMGLGMGYQPGALPVTESLYNRLLRLPIYPTLTQAEQEHVIHTMLLFFDPAEARQ